MTLEQMLWTRLRRLCFDVEARGQSRFLILTYYSTFTARGALAIARRCAAAPKRRAPCLKYMYVFFVASNMILP